MQPMESLGPSRAHAGPNDPLGERGLLSLTGFALSAGSVALALWLALEPRVELGVPAGRLAPGDTVVAVSPGSPAWNDGLRPGMVVTEADQLALAITAVDGGGNAVRTSAEQAFAIVYDQTRWAWLAALALATAVFIGRSAGRRARAFGLAALAQPAATLPLMASGVPPLMVAGATLGPAAGVLAAVALSPTRLRPAAGAALGSAALVAVGGWLAAPFLAPALYPLAEALRLTVWAIALALVCVGLARPYVNGSGRVSAQELIAAGCGAGLGLFFSLVVRPAPIVTAGAILVGGAIGFAGVRGVPFLPTRLIPGPLRHRLVGDALDAERERLAGEIHDVPLQELSMVIEELDEAGAAEAADHLRIVSEQLRSVGSELASPLVEQLGLADALLAEVDAERSPQVSFFPAVLVDGELPNGVGREIYRIGAEAIRNACRHSGARRIDLVLETTPASCRLVVRDDGQGLDVRAVKAARDGDHYGLVAMRQRANSIGAELRLRSTPGAGTEVELRWQAA